MKVIYQRIFFIMAIICLKSPLGNATDITHDDIISTTTISRSNSNDSLVIPSTLDPNATAEHGTLGAALQPDPALAATHQAATSQSQVEINHPPNTRWWWLSNLTQICGLTYKFTAIVYHPPLNPDLIILPLLLSSILDCGHMGIQTSTLLQMNCLNNTPEAYEDHIDLHTVMTKCLDIPSALLDAGTLTYLLSAQTIPLWLWGYIGASVVSHNAVESMFLSSIAKSVKGWWNFCQKWGATHRSVVTPQSGLNETELNAV